MSCFRCFFVETNNLLKMRIETRKMQTIALSLALAMGLFWPTLVTAQQGGMMGYGKTTETQNQSFFGKDRGSSSDGLSLQGFGENQNGLTLQNFGEPDAPLGGGWLVLVTAGFGYAAMKTRKNKKQKKSVK